VGGATLFHFHFTAFRQMMRVDGLVFSVTRHSLEL